MPQTLIHRVRASEFDSGRTSGVPTEMAGRMKALERANREWREANGILRKASAHLRWQDSTAG